MQSSRWLIATVLVAVALSACARNQEIPTGHVEADLVFELSDGRSVGEPAWAPNGQELAFTTFDPHDGKGAIYALDLGTGQARALTNPGYASAPSWSPDGKHIVYNSLREILVVATDGSKAPQSLASGQTAAWAPHADQIAILEVTTQDPWSYNLKIWDMETGHERVVVAGLVGEIIDDLAWSPDGTRLAFSVSRAKALDSSATRNIYVYDLEQDELLQFSFGDNDFDPAWAPNGKEIAYLHLPPGETYPSVVLSQVDGSCSTEIAGLQGISSIAWSPDGSQLAHSKSTGIYILDLAAVFGEHFLTTGPTCESPT